MKKLLLLIIFLLFPTYVFAYSKYIVPGGNTLGIEVDTDGVMVIGFYKINGKYNKSSLKSGDYITKINNENVDSVEDMTKVIEKSINDDNVNITYVRKGDIKNTNLNLILDEGKVKTGLYVKSSIKGIGTLSYIDPETRIYGALGHEIVENNTGSIVEIKSGIIFNSTITGIEKSKVGTPGSKIADFNYNINYGNIIKNTQYGIYGIYNEKLPNINTMEVSDDIKIGKATVKTVIDGENVEDFDIEITKINKHSETKNITVNITDKRLLNKTGGVVQGMSGSPIIQDNKIVGVLTHVIVDNPISGYGIFITTMLTEGEKN